MLKFERKNVNKKARQIDLNQIFSQSKLYLIEVNWLGFSVAEI